MATGAVTSAQKVLTEYCSGLINYKAMLIILFINTDDVYVFYVGL